MAWPTVNSGQLMTAAQYNVLSAAIATWAGNVDGSGFTLSNVVIAGTATSVAAGTAGAVLYQSAPNVSAFLAGNTAATDMVLVSHGNGTTASPPTFTNAPALSLANMTGVPTAMGTIPITQGGTGQITGPAALTALGAGSAALLTAGVANGAATLDATGHLTSAQIPASLVGAVVYQGTWDAAANSPALVSGTGTKGFYYKVSTAGTSTIDGISQWNLGDTIIFDGTVWDKIDGQAIEVVSVFGRSNAVVAVSADYATFYDSLGAATSAVSAIPTASSSTARGLLTSTDWTTFNSKQPLLTLGNLTEATSSVLTISGGSAAIVGSGLSITVAKASSSASGYLSAADWTSFNSKAGALTGQALTESTSAVLTITGGSASLLSATSITVKQASATQAGYLGSADWTTFNSKIGAITVTSDTNVLGSVSGGAITLGWSGTLAAGRLNPQVVQAVTNDTNITGTVNAQILALGFAGTLAPGRLNSNVVQSVTNDTNVTGTIAAQVLTLGFTGTLAKARLFATTVYTDQANTFGAFPQVFSGAVTHSTSTLLSGVATFTVAPVFTDQPNSRLALGLGSAAVLNAAVANGAATLDSSGRLTAAQIPAALVGAVVFQGTWNASTNSPALVSGTGTKGFYYKVSTAGTTTIDGNSSWGLGDTIIFDGTVWDKIDGQAVEVVTVFGRSGAVVATTGDYSFSQISGVASIAQLPTGIPVGSLSGIVPIASGGTGAATFLAAGLPTLAANNVFAGINSFTSSLYTATVVPASVAFLVNAPAAGVVNPFVYQANASNTTIYWTISTRGYGTGNVTSAAIQTTSNSDFVLLQPAGGNVGIGTNTPGSTLSVNGTLGVNGAATVSATGANAVLTISNQTNGYLTNLLLAGNLGNWTLSNRGSADTPNTRLGFFNNAGSETLTLLQTGNIGIGNVNPGSYFTIGANLFTVASTTGNTTIAGTLSVTGAASFAAGITVSGGTVSIPGVALLAAANTFTTTSTTNFQGPVATVGNLTANSSVAGVVLVAQSTFATGVAGAQFGANSSWWYLTNQGASTTPNNRLSLGNTGGTEVVTVLQSGNVGIGNTNPVAPLHILTAATSNAQRNFVVEQTATTSSPEFAFYKNRGTRATPVAVASGDVLGVLDWCGYDGANDVPNAGRGASIVAQAVEAWTSTAHGTSLAFSTTPATTTSRTNALFIGSDQSASFYGNLAVSGNATFTGTLGVTGAATLTGGVYTSAVGNAVYSTRPSTFAGNGVNWCLAIQNAGASDNVALGQSSTTYTTGGVLGWVGNSMAYLYFPTELRIGTGVGSTPLMDLTSGAVTIGGTLSVTGAVTFAGGISSSPTFGGGITVVQGINQTNSSYTSSFAGSVSFASPINGLVSFGGGITVAQGITQTSVYPSSFTGPVSMASTLAVTGAATFSNALTINSGSIAEYSTSASSPAQWTIGRVSSDLLIGACAGGGNYFTNVAAAGDVALRVQSGTNTLHLGCGLSSASTIQIISSGATIGGTLGVTGAATFSNSMMISPTWAGTGGNCFQYNPTLTGTTGGNLYGFNCSINLAASATVNAYFGLNINAPALGTGASITNGIYAIYINPLKQTGVAICYAINQSGVNDLNLFNGPTTFGTTLSVTGAATFNGAVTMNAPLNTITAASPALKVLDTLGGSGAFFGHFGASTDAANFSINRNPITGVFSNTAKNAVQLVLGCTATGYASFQVNNGNGPNVIGQIAMQVMGGVSIGNIVDPGYQNLSVSGTLAVTGLSSIKGLATAVRTVTTNDTSTTNDRVLLCNTPAQTETLPASPTTGQEYYLCNTSGNYPTIISGNGKNIQAGNLAAASTYTLSYNSSAIFTFDGTVWRVASQSFFNLASNNVFNIPAAGTVPTTLLANSGGRIRIRCTTGSGQLYDNLFVTTASAITLATATQINAGVQFTVAVSGLVVTVTNVNAASNYYILVDSW